MNDAYIIGSYSTQFKRWPDKTYRDLARDVYLGVLADAGMADGSEIETEPDKIIREK